MALELKRACERCGQTLGAVDKAYICVYECTFCHACTLWMGFVCPNCGGELVRRPRPKGADDGEGSRVETDSYGVLSG